MLKLVSPAGRALGRGGENLGWIGTAPPDAVAPVLGGTEREEAPMGLDRGGPLTTERGVVLVMLALQASRPEITCAGVEEETEEGAKDEEDDEGMDEEEEETGGRTPRG